MDRDMGYLVFRGLIVVFMAVIAWLLIISFLADLILHRAMHAPWRSVDVLLMGPGAVVVFWWVWKMIRDVTADAIDAVNAARYRWHSIWRR
jgi:hypothetical protein